MNVQISSRSLELGERLKEQVERRSRFALGRFATRIDRVLIQLEDENGPRGGLDRACRIEVRLKPTGEVRVADLDSELLTGLDRALERSARAVSRRLELERERETAGDIHNEGSLR